MAELELSDTLSIHAYRLEVSYTVARLHALEETKHLAADFEEAAEKLALLEEEGMRLDLLRVETQAEVETADDGWDDCVQAFQRRLLELSGNSMDHELYRRYFAEIPSHVTSLSYAAEIMISKDLEEALKEEPQIELAAYGERLQAKRLPLEASIRERTRLEVEHAKFHNRVTLAKQLVNKLRRITVANLEEIAIAKGRPREWAGRFFHEVNPILEAIDADGSVHTAHAPAHAHNGNGNGAGAGEIEAPAVTSA